MIYFADRYKRRPARFEDPTPRVRVYGLCPWRTGIPGLPTDMLARNLPRLYVIPVPRHSSERSESRKTVATLTRVRPTPTLVREATGTGEYPGKRIFDCIASGTLLVLAFPLFALCALLVRLGSKGPVLFGHRRLGRDGEAFECLKFRSMVVGAEDLLEEDRQLRDAHRQNGFKLPTEDDPRVTRVGRFLRKTHLDELPQLLNVLRGDMALVGPRPIVEEELELYGAGARQLQRVRPGIFGAWTALGHARPGYPRRCDVELNYVRDMSLQQDIELLLRNFFVVLKGQ